MNYLTIYFSMKGQTIAPGMQIVNLEKGHTAVVAETIRQEFRSRICLRLKPSDPMKKII